MQPDDQIPWSFPIVSEGGGSTVAPVTEGATVDIDNRFIINSQVKLMSTCEPVRLAV